MDCQRRKSIRVDIPVPNLTQTKARRKKIGSEKELHQKMRRLKAQLMGMFLGKSQMPLDSPFLPDSATFVRRDFAATEAARIGGAAAAPALELVRAQVPAQFGASLKVRFANRTGTLVSLFMYVGAMPP